MPSAVLLSKRQEVDQACIAIAYSDIIITITVAYCHIAIGTYPLTSRTTVTIMGTWFLLLGKYSAKYLHVSYPLGEWT